LIVQALPFVGKILTSRLTKPSVETSSPNVASPIAPGPMGSQASTRAAMTVAAAVIARI